MPVTQDRRELLLSVAAELFSTRPYDEVTTTEITKRAGVAYGLLAHHFGNKRGLYLATLEFAASQLRGVRDAPLAGDTPLEQLRTGLTREIEYLDANQNVYLALVHGNLGADKDARATIEQLRSEAAMPILDRLGATQPLHPVLRSAIRGWIGYCSEIVVDHIQHHDVAVDELVELLIATLTASLAGAQQLAPEIALDLDAIGEPA
ncbi:MAG TPA: TetR/AcrR family transcriptional regulator [Solirubrobacteraceae bacterium]|jgi:AcrR family transcriptional regulator